MDTGNYVTQEYVQEGEFRQRPQEVCVLPAGQGLGKGLLGREND